MGTSPHSAWERAGRGPALVAALLACLSLAVAFAAVAARPAGALELGVSDSDAATFSEPYWDALNVRRARIVVPWDVATTAGGAGVQRRENFERYRADAAAKGVALLVVFGPSADVRAPDTGDPLAPSADEFAAGFAAFRARYPDVTTFGAWNEPNNRDTASYPLGSNPQLAADYWLRAQSACPGCTVLAGDFAGIPGDDVYVDAYQGRLAAAGAVPAVWAFHAHSDVNRYQVVGASDARVTRYYLSKLQGPWAGARIWIDEVGARYRDASGLVWGDASQRDSTSLLLGLATLDPRIDAIYYYNYSNQCATPGGCAVQDRGLASPTPFDGQPPNYDALNRRRLAFDVIAAGGPVIAPVESLPPAVVIDTPAQGAALPTSTPAFAGRASIRPEADPVVTLQLFPGAGDTESSAPRATLTAPVGADGTWSATATRALPDGVYTARAVQAGNPASTGISEDVIFTLDTVAPTSAIADGPPDTTGAREATFTLAASEPGATLACSIDRRRRVPCGSPLTLRRLARGSHTLAVLARDAAGNVQRVATRRTWRVVALASALVPRLGDLDAALAGGLPLTAACAGRCRVTVRLYLPAATARRVGLVGRPVAANDPARPRPSARGYVSVAGDVLARSRAGGATLELQPRAASARALSRTRSLTLRLGIALSEPGSSRPVVISRQVTLVRAGALGSLAARGLPVTVACSGGCTASGGLWVTRTLGKSLRVPGRAVTGGRRLGLPRGERYLPLGAQRVALRAGGGVNLTLPVARPARRRLAALSDAGLRVTALVTADATPDRALSWPLALSR